MSGPFADGTADQPSKTYEGSCHCGKVSFTAKISPPVEEGPVMNCSCSICSINGYLMVYPLEANINWHSGLEDMTVYKFGKQRLAHTFCPVCGTSVSGRSTDPDFFGDVRALNVRTLKGLDLDKLRLHKTNGPPS